MPWRKYVNTVYANCTTNIKVLPRQICYLKNENPFKIKSETPMK